MSGPVLELFGSGSGQMTTGPCKRIEGLLGTSSAGEHVAAEPMDKVCGFMSWYNSEENNPRAC
jgi:hypothetical protein